ncbi:hypothetical protein J2S97_001764 [Arthrobacter oryzae]|nr:hypothetical protein [Arthrobacter oryzae]
MSVITSERSSAAGTVHGINDRTTYANGGPA